MRMRLVAISLLFFGWFALLANTAQADAGVVLITNTDHVQIVVDEQGVMTVGVTFANNTDHPMSATAAITPAVGPCVVKAPSAPVLANHQSSLMFEFVGCPDTQFGFTVTVEGRAFPLTADPPKAPSPDFRLLLGFPVAAVLAIILLVAAFGTWKAPSGLDKNWGMMLPGISATWKFSDSWASNATVVTAIFAGLYGSKEVAALLLAEKSADVVAIGLLASALAVGLAALGPMILQAARKDFAKQQVGSEEVPAGNYVRPGGLIAAGVCTLTGTVGQLIVLVAAVVSTSPARYDWLMAIVVVALVLIYWYGWKSTRQSLTTGAIPTSSDEESLTSTSHSRSRPGGVL